MPSPHDELRRLFDSPVPTHTTSGFDGATATAPIDETRCASNSGVQVTPLFVVFHTPPAAAAMYITLPSRSPALPVEAIATSDTRPLITAGPNERNFRSASSA